MVLDVFDAALNSAGCSLHLGHVLAHHRGARKVLGVMRHHAKVFVVDALGLQGRRRASQRARFVLRDVEVHLVDRGLRRRLGVRVRGRVIGVQNAAMLGAVPVGLLAAGLLVAGIGLRPTGMLMAGLWVLATAVALLAPALRRLEVSGADHR